MKFDNLFAQRLSERLEQLNCTLKEFAPGTIDNPTARLLIQYDPNILAHTLLEAIQAEITNTSSKDYNYHIEYPEFFGNNTCGINIQYSAK